MSQKMPGVESRPLDAGDALIARENLARWLEGQGSDAMITQVDADVRPGYLMLTATLDNGRVATCLLDLAITYRDPKMGRDDLWPWSWRA